MKRRLNKINIKKTVQILREIPKYFLRHIRHRTSIYFLDQKNLTPEKKKEFISICEKIIEDMKNSGVFKYKDLDLMDLVVPQFFGFSTNFASAVKVHILSNNKLKSRIFNLNYYYRFLRRYKITKRTGMKNIGLFNTDPIDQIKKKNKQYDVAFICSCEAFVGSFIDFFNLFEQKNKNILLILPKQANRWKTILNSADKPKNVHIVYIEDFFTEERKKKLYSLREHFMQLFKNNKEILKKIFKIGKSNMYSQLKIPLKKFSSDYLPELVIYYDIADEILKSYDIKTLVGGRVKRFVENAFYLAAKNNNIKSISIIHVYYHDSLDSYYDLSQVDLVDYAFVPSKYDQGLFSSRKSPSSKTKIICLGNPQLQKIYDKTIIFKNYKKKFNLNKDFVVFMEGIETHPFSWAAQIFDVCKELGYPLFIKIHPGGNKSRYASLEKEGAILVDNSDVSLYPLMKEAKIVISCASIASPEAVLIGTPSFFYEGGLRCESATHYIIEFFNKFGIPIIKNKKNLKKKIQYLYSIPKQEALKNYSKFIDNYSVKTEKNIVESIAEFI